MQLSVGEAIARDGCVWLWPGLYLEASNFENTCAAYKAKVCLSNGYFGNIK